MNPTFYDILGVSPTASSDQIKTAWRDAADRFGPGSGGSSAQFRLFNEAADVLLDPARRKAYDEQLVADGQESTGAAGPTSEATAARDTQKPIGKRVPWLPRREKTEKAAAPPFAGELTADRADSGIPGKGIPVWALFVLGLVAGLTMGAAIYLYTGYQRASAYEEALAPAASAAESAAEATLSYGYETLESDRDAAAKFLTPKYRSEYITTFDLVKEPAQQTKAKVEAETLASSTMVDTEGNRGPDKVRVLLFVDQTTVSTANSGEPTRALNRVRFDMVKVDGTWLVDHITSY